MVGAQRVREGVVTEESGEIGKEQAVKSPEN